MSARHVRPTHFLAFPITNPACQARAQEVVDILLQARPRPDGVDESLAASPRSLHLTLGIMALSTEKAARPEQIASGGSSAMPLRTVEDASRLLQDCRTGLRELLEEDHTKEIKINLNRLESFQSDPKKCRVLYAEPEKGSLGVETLHQLAAYVRERFHNEGMLVDYKQPLTLHCTLMKASARKSYPNKQGRGRVAEEKQKKRRDSTASVSDGAEEPILKAGDGGQDLIGEGAIGSLRSPAKAANDVEKKTNHKRHRKGVTKNYPFDASLLLNADPPYALGETMIDSIHLYQMGKKDNAGAYIVLSEIKLFD